MSLEGNKAVAKRFYQLFSEKDLEGILETIAEDAVDHALPPVLPSGKAGIRQAFEMWLAAFDDLRLEPVIVIAEGDLVAAHVRCTGKHTGAFMGHPATNKSIDITITEIFRIEDGVLKERWATEDNAGMFMQLGMQPPDLPA